MATTCAAKLGAHLRPVASLLVLVLTLQAGEARGISIRRSVPGNDIDAVASLAARESAASFAGRRERMRRRQEQAANRAKPRQGNTWLDSKSFDSAIETAVGLWQDLPFGHFRPADSGGETASPSNKTGTDGPQDDPTGLAPAQAPGVINSLGEGFDPQFLTIPLRNGSQLYVVPDVNFGLEANLRASIDLNDIYRNEAKKHTIFNYASTAYPDGVGTEAADIARWDGGRYLYTVSAIVDDTLRALLSKTEDVLGEYEDCGHITNNGTPLKGFDPHVIIHPNGRKYLTWSNHEYVQIVQMTSPNTTVGPIVNLVSYGVNTEAPTSWFYPNRRNGSQTLNLAYAEGIFGQANYNTRVLFQDVASDPLDPAQWYQRGASTLSSSSSRGVFGPGSGSFFRGPDGRTWFGYGAFDKQDGADGGKNDRFVRVQVAEADEVGVWIPTQVVRTPKTY